MPFLLFLLSVATLAAVASKASAKGRPPNGPTQTFTLDADMPDDLRNQVLAALVGGTDPATLDAFATAIQGRYPLSAGLLHAKASSLRAGLPSLPAANDPGGPPLDAGMPQAMVAFVHTELATETDATRLFNLSNTIAQQYPIAAALLAQRAAVLNVQPHTVPPQPTPAPSPSPTPGPTNPPAPAPTFPGLDLGIPPDVAQAVTAALITENDPARLQAMAAQIQPQYPLAANLLTTKANTLLALQRPVVPSPEPTPSPQPTPSPTPGVPSGPMIGMDPGMPPETVQLVLNELANEGEPVKLQALADELAPKYPIAAGLLRTRANVILATRPPPQILPGPTPTPTIVTSAYTVQEGDYPWKIATKLTGHGARWPELVAANPTKARAKDGNFASLLPGEKLSVPASWLGQPSAPPSVASGPSNGAPTNTPPVISPAPSDSIALDANVPPDLAAAIRNALQTGTDPSQVRGFATAVAQRGYPKAAELLNAKANALDAFGPSKGIVLANTTPEHAVAPGSMPLLPTYKVKPGDSPSKIAAALVHDGNRWKELVAANPQKKRAKDGNFASLLPGEVLRLPTSWAPHGSGPAPAQLPQGGA